MTLLSSRLCARSTFWLSKLSNPAFPFSFSNSDMKLSAAAREKSKIAKP